MSKLSEEYLKILKDIDKNISNEDEKQYVFKKVSELSALYMDIMDRITGVNSKRMEEIEKYQDEMEKKLDKVKGTVDLIKKDIYEDEDYDFEIICPYCNHEFVADVEEELKEEIECPECHNIIELDWDGEDEECNGHCSSCEHHHECDEDEDNKNEDDGENIENNDDDM